MTTVGYDGYVRGILARPGPRVIPRGFVSEALNLTAVQGRWRSRPGLVPAHGAPFVDGSGDPLPVRGIGVHVRSDGSRDYLVAAKETIWRMPFNGDPVQLSLAALPSTEQTRVDPTAGVKFLTLSGADNTTFIFDGVNPSLKWTGTTLTKVGLPVPTAPAAPSANGGTSIGPGVRDYYRTLKSPFHEGDLSTATRVTQVGSGGKTFASPTNGVDYDDPQVTKWVLYRTQAGGATRFFVGEADIGIAIADNLTDEVLGAGAAAEQLVNRAPDVDPFTGKFTALVEHQSLLWGVDAYDTSLVRFSWGTDQYIAPEGWPEERTIPIAHGDGDYIVGLASFFDWLVVFKQLTTWAIVGSLDAGYTVVPIMAAGEQRQGVGCIAAGGIKQLENALAFPSRDGIYLIERFAGVQAGIQAKKLSDAVNSLYHCTNAARGAAAFYDRNHRVLGFMMHG